MWAWALFIAVGFVFISRGAQATVCLRYDAVNPSGKKCYRFFTWLPTDFKATHENGEKWCKRLGGNLVTVHNAFEQALVYATAKKIGTGNILLGLKRPYSMNNFDSCSDGWQWDDGKYAAYYNWASGEPKCEETSIYASMQMSDGHWAVHTAKDIASVACEFEDDGLGKGTCKGNYANDGNNCYYYFETTASYSDARMYCLSIDGAKNKSRLASPSDLTKAKFIYGYVKNFTNSQDYTIGLTDPKDSGSWTWDDGSSYSSYYSNWEQGFPVNKVGLDCAQVQISNGKWYNTACDTKSPFVCQLRHSDLPSSLMVDSDLQEKTDVRETMQKQLDEMKQRR